MERIMSCTKCGKELKKGEKFCPYCGTKAETEKTDSGDILKPVSSKVAEGATYAAEQIKQIDVNDMKGIFTNVTSTDSIVYLIAGSLLLFTSIYSFFEWMDSKILFLSFMSAAFLYIYFFITKKKTKGGVSSTQLVFGITAILCLLAALQWIPAFLNILCLIICATIGIVLSAVGIVQIYKDMPKNKSVGGTGPGRNNSFNTNRMTNSAKANRFNMNGVPIANYNPKFDYTPIGMWGYFLYTILFNIPVIGWLCLIIFSIGGTRNINLRNLARSYACRYILAFVVGLPVLLLLATTGFTLFH